MQRKPQAAFTLIELLVVVAILGILATLLTGNFLSSLKRGRDTRRKADIQSIQKAFEIYYQDNNQYPPSDALGDTSLCHPDGCSKKIYMSELPLDPRAGIAYVYETDSTRSYYQLYSCLENDQDIGAGINLISGEQDPSGWGNSCGSCGVCKFKVESAKRPIRKG
ncbi:MAG: Type II secretion system protein G precursor [Microgenomates bacterium OLB22]|nr:MAG: Type II secretion system protein G precursor [Microgenomates bacterium OLB22]